MSSHFIFDAQSRHQHYIERYKTGEINRLNKFLKRLERQLIARLSTQQTFRSRKRTLSVLKAIHDDSLDSLNEYAEQLLLDLETFGEAEAEFSATTISKGLEVETTLPATEQIIAAAKARPFNSKLLRDELRDFPRQQARYIRNSVATGFAEGRTNPQIIKDVVGTSELKFKDGAMEVTRNTAKRLVRTSVQHTSAVAQQEVYKNNADIIKQYAWVSTLDSRTSPTCQKRDGQVYKINKGPLPPAHPNCRSTTVPVFKGETATVDGVLRLDLETGTRASKGTTGGKQVSIKNNYNTWLGTQSKAFQVDALGSTKAELFRKGGLTVDKFVDRLDKPLTLEELRLTFPTAWEKADLAA